MTVRVAERGQGMRRVLEQLERLGEQLEAGPGVPTMLDLGRAGVADVQERFATGGYGTWAPLSPATVRRKGGSTVILIETGTMFRSVGIGEVTERRVTVTVPRGGRDNSPEVPGRHQRGVPSRNLPQRKIVEVTARLLDRLRPIVKGWAGRWRR